MKNLCEFSGVNRLPAQTMGFSCRNTISAPFAPAVLYRIAISFASLLGSIAAGAQWGDFTYTETPESITISDCTASGKHVILIPASISGKAVTRIASNAFEGISAPGFIKIPATVTTIEENAFLGATYGSVRFGGDIPPIVGTGLTGPFYYKKGVSGVESLAGYSATEGTAPVSQSVPINVNMPLGTNPDIYQTLVYMTSTASYNLPVSPSTTEVITSGELPPGLYFQKLSHFSESWGLWRRSPSPQGIYSGVVTFTNGLGDDVVLPFRIDTNKYIEIIVESQGGGTCAGGGIYPVGTQIQLTATPQPGYLFTRWVLLGHYNSPPQNPLITTIEDSDQLYYHYRGEFEQDSADDDNDGYTNYQEIVVYLTNPGVADTDQDGVIDSQDQLPLDVTETLDTDDDGIGDNADTDDDGDGYSDDDEINIYGTNSKRADSDGDGLTDPVEIQTHLTNPNIADTDSDGLSDGAEINSHGTLPKVGDSDGDGFLDGYELITGKLPLDPLDKPALVAQARTAIEFTFPAAIGKTYRIEASTDLAVWGTVESGIDGTGGQIQRFYSILNVPMRYFRVEEDTQ